MRKALENYKFESCNSHYIGSIVRINDYLKGSLIKDVIEISFNKLYANLILEFHNYGIIKIDDIFVNILNNFFSLDKLSDEYKKLIGSINMLYGRLSPYDRNKINQFMGSIYDKIIESNPHNWLYIDTNFMYFANN